jgi:hypothetical protein
MSFATRFIVGLRGLGQVSTDFYWTMGRLEKSKTSKWSGGDYLEVTRSGPKMEFYFRNFGAAVINFGLCHPFLLVVSSVKVYHESICWLAVAGD